MANINIDQLANAISDAVRGYTEEVSEAIAVAVDETAKECAAEIKANSPKKTGDYAKGWTIKKEGGIGKTKRTVWNKDYAWKTHLLEKGHAKRGGGRVAGIPHIGPSERKYVRKLTDRIERIIRNGGE